MLFIYHHNKSSPFATPQPLINENPIAIGHHLTAQIKGVI